MHAHQRSQGSVNRATERFTPADRVERREFGPLGPLKNRHNNLRRVFRGRLLDRKHLAAALVAGAVTRLF